MTPLLFLAGPYSTNPAHNTNRAIRVATHVWQFGEWAPYVPHLTFFWDAVTPMEYEEWLAYDLAVLKHCKAFCRLPGESKGADGEHARAIEWGLQIVEFEDLPWQARNEWWT